jgi:hypothetical protein
LLEQAATAVAAYPPAIGEETHRNRREIKKHACKIDNWVAQTFHCLFGLFNLYKLQEETTAHVTHHFFHNAMTQLTRKHDAHVAA